MTRESKNYAYLLFDWDGCLAKTLEVWLTVYQDVFAEYGVTVSAAEISHNWGDIDFYEKFGITDPNCRSKCDELAGSRLKTVDLYDGGKELLYGLKQQGRRLALLSSSRRSVIEKGLAHNGLIDIFELLLSGDDVTEHKPHPEVVEKAIEFFGASKEECVLIGDSRNDLGAAQNAQIDSILVYPASHHVLYDLNELKKYKPTHTVTNLLELSTLL